MEIQFMKKYPHFYLEIVQEIDKYVGAAVMTDQIVKRVLYRIDRLLSEKGDTLTVPIIKRLTKKAAHELVNRKKQIDVLTDDDLLTAHADNVHLIDDQLTDNELLHDIILLTKNNDERVIINAWANGCNDTEIAAILTNIRGGTVESNRSKIRRYKTRLRKSEKLQLLFAA